MIKMIGIILLMPPIVILEKFFCKKNFIQDLAYSRNVRTIGKILGNFVI